MNNWNEQQHVSGLLWYRVRLCYLRLLDILFAQVYVCFANESTILLSNQIHFEWFIIVFVEG